MHGGFLWFADTFLEKIFCVINGSLTGRQCHNKQHSYGTSHERGSVFRQCFHGKAILLFHLLLRSFTIGER